MLSLRSMFQTVGPPCKLKVFAPNGETMEFRGWLGLRVSPQDRNLVELFVLRKGWPVEVVSKKVVVVNQEMGRTVYSPRIAHSRGIAHEFLTSREVTWLSRNPQWPGILELESNPVENGE